MSLTSELEDRFGFKVDEFNNLEKETYFKMLEVVQESQMSPEKLRAYIVSMREAVTKDLINEPEFIRIFIFKFENRKQILLKARLQNYVLLEAFLISPERAKQQLEGMVSNIAGRG